MDAVLEAAYAWDFENRLTSANMTGGAAVAHQYDADGNRVQTSVTASGNTATTNMLVDTVAGLSQVVAETDGSGSLTALYIRNGDELLEVMRPVGGGTWTTRFVERDGLSSVRVLTDESGTTTDSRGYEAFGTKNTEEGNDPLAYGFAGEPFERTSQLAYHRARWMDAKLDRFEGMDPSLGDVQAPVTLQLYMYAAANPVENIDPSGRDADFGAGLSFGSLLTSLGIGNWGVRAPQGKTFTSFDLAVWEALDVAAKKSAGISHAQPESGAHVTTGALHPEVPASVDEFVTSRGRVFTYTIGPASRFADSFSNFLLHDDTLAALLHTHPNAGTYDTSDSLQMDINPEAFSCPDARQHMDNVINAPNYIGSFVRTVTGNTLAWLRGVQRSPRHAR